MEIGLYVLLGLILCILIGFIVVYFYKKSQLETIPIKENENPLLIQKDIKNSKEILALKIETLQKEILDNKTSISTALDKINENTDKYNLYFNTNLTELNSEFKTLKLNLNKQDSDLKTDLNGQKESINRSFTQVMQNLNVLTESSKTLKEVEDKVKSLNNVFLNNSKTRGNLGEYLLDKLLSELYGDTQDLWKAQHKLPDGKIVDVIVKTSQENEDIAVDAKFPITNYNNYLKAEDKHSKEQFLKDFKRDFKLRVEEVAKYISQKNEISSAIMFIPSEEIFSFVYAEFQDDVIKFAFNKKVWITSPTTMSALLFILDKHLKESKFNKNLETIRLNLLKIKDDFDRWIDRWETFKKDLDKMNRDVNDLNMTHQKISKKYQTIYKNQHLENQQIE